MPVTARPTPAGRKRRWRARSACGSAGPRIYHGSATDEPWLNKGARDPLAADISQGLTIYRRAMLLLAAYLAILAFA